jgi:tRNA(adenine34) deaminase
MRLALAEARKAFESDEVPVGAVIVDEGTGRVIAKAHNQRELLQDPTAHAEVLAITQAAAHYRSWRLTEATLYVTLEPCLMCAGAIVLARIPRVVYGAPDPKAGAHCSVYEVLANAKNNHVPKVERGILADESADLLREFFQRKRERPAGGNGARGNGAGDIER